MLFLFFGGRSSGIIYQGTMVSEIDEYTYLVAGCVPKEEKNWAFPPVISWSAAFFPARFRLIKRLTVTSWMKNARNTSNAALSFQRHHPKYLVHLSRRLIDDIRFSLAWVLSHHLQGMLRCSPMLRHLTSRAITPPEFASSTFVLILRRNNTLC